MQFCPPIRARAVFLSRFFIPVLAALVALPAWADQVTLKNGDRVTGSVVKKDGKDLTVKTDQLGEVKLAWDQVTSIKTDKPVNVVLADKRSAKGTIATEGAMVQIASQPPVSAALADVATIRNDDEQAAFDRLQHPRWDELWAGTGTLGFAGTTGNAETLTFTTGLTAARATNTDKTSLYFNAIKASALVDGKDADTAEAVRGGWAYQHNVSPRLFVSIFNDYEYDKFQDLNLRLTFGGTFGYHAIKTMRSQLDVVGGVDYNHASFTPALKQSGAEFTWGDNYNFKVSSNSSIVQSFRMFNNLSDLGTYRLNFDAGTSTKIAKWLTWNVALSDRYLNHPALGRKTNDFLYTTGVGVTFAR